MSGSLKSSVKALGTMILEIKIAAGRDMMEATTRCAAASSKALFSTDAYSTRTPPDIVDMLAVISKNKSLFDKRERYDFIVSGASMVPRNNDADRPKARAPFRPKVFRRTLLESPNN